MDSQDKKGIDRRTFIVGVSTGVVAATCSSKNRQKKPGSDDASVKIASPREALVALALLIGPWSEADRGVAEEFLDRFLSEEKLATTFSEHSKAIATLPSHLPTAKSGRLDEIPLDSLSAGEKSALLTVLGHIYYVKEARFYAAGEPDAGTCIGDLNFITKAPS